MTTSLPPVLVFGTGLTHQLLPIREEIDAAARRRMAPLKSWAELLRAVAHRENMPDVCNPFLEGRPTLLWEEMIRQKVDSKSSSKKAAYAIESSLRTSVAKVLKESSVEARSHIDQQKLKELKKNVGSHLVSLNFDHLLISKATRPILFNNKDGGKDRLTCTVEEEATIWHPHGSVTRPQSICLGLRGYGLLPEEWSQRFIRFRSLRSRRSRELGETDSARRRLHAERIERITSLISTDPDSFIGRVLLAPLIFFGVGLGESEWGWWWILNQRARNLARVPALARPPTVIVRQSSDPNAAFWASRPVGLTPLFVPDWGAGWEVMNQWLVRQNEAAGAM